MVRGRLGYRLGVYFERYRRKQTRYRLGEYYLSLRYNGKKSITLIRQQGMLGGCSKKVRHNYSQPEKQECGESHLLGGWARPSKGLNQDDGLQRKRKEGMQRKELKTSLKFHKAKQSLSDVSRKIHVFI